MAPANRSPRFTIVLPVLDRADTVARTVVSVLGQTFGDLELVVVDRGSSDPTREAVRSVADARVRLLSCRGERNGADPSGANPSGANPSGADPDPAARSVRAAIEHGLRRGRGPWSAVLDPDTAARPHWLARVAFLVERTPAVVAFCGGVQHHRDGSRSAIHPSGPCGRPGAVVAQRTVLLDALVQRRPELDDPADLGRWVAARDELSPEGAWPAVHTPEDLLDWYDQPRRRVAGGEEARLAWARQAIEVLGDSPIPDVELLVRYATLGGIAAARLRRHRDARELLALARRVQPLDVRSLARWAVASVPALSERAWLAAETPPVDEALAEHGAMAPATGSHEHVVALGP